MGLTGMGGASLMAPILVFIFHYQAKTAIGSDLAYAAIAKSFGAWQHKRAGSVDIAIVKNLAIGSVPASLLGVWLLHSIDKNGGAGADHLITRILGVVLLVTATIMIARSIPKVEAAIEKRRDGKPLVDGRWAILVGAVGGFLVGLTSVGAGTLFGVALLVVFGMGARKMVGTDLYHAALLSTAAAIGHIYAGDVNYSLVANLLIGAIPGVLIGSHFSARMPEKALRPTLATVLLATGIRTFI